MRIALSVRRQAIGGVTVALVAVGIVAAAVAYAIDLDDANRLLDAEMQEIAHFAAPTLAERPEADRADPGGRIVLIQVFGPDGRLAYVSDRTVLPPPEGPPGFSKLQVGDRGWRVFAVRRNTTTVQVAQPLALRRRLARTAALEAAVPVILAIPLGWIAIGLGLGQMMTSLSRLSSAVAALGVEARAPISRDGVPDEFTPLVDSMNALIERLRLSLDQQKRFLSDAAHELRTPLTALRLQIDLLRADGTSRELDAVLPELARGAGRASALVDQLLRMARYDAGEGRAEPVTIDVAPLVVGCMADFVALAESKAIDLGLVASETVHLCAVPRDIELLVANLIENAVRYTPQGGVVDVAVRRAGDRAVIEIADTGPGIPEALIPRVFDRFFRAPDAGAEGSGLGLAICRAIAQRHGLSLTLENRPGGGLKAIVSGEAWRDAACA